MNLSEPYNTSDNAFNSQFRRVFDVMVAPNLYGDIISYVMLRTVLHITSHDLHLVIGTLPPLSSVLLALFHPSMLGIISLWASRK